jgi:hypothetical protein
MDPRRAKYCVLQERYRLDQNDAIWTSGCIHTRVQNTLLFIVADRILGVSVYEVCENHSLGSKLLGHAMTWLAKMSFLINDKRKSHIK